MFNIQLTKSGGPETLEYTERPDLEGTELADDEVLIDVSYSGINFADVMMRQGLYPDAPKKPFVPGYELSGVIRKVGAGVSDLAPGDSIMGGTLFGGYSSQVILQRYQVRKLPENWSLEQGAAFPVSFLTAYLALFEHSRVREGDTIYIDCATGALGQMCFQLLQEKENITLFGGTTSPEKREFIEMLGATAVVNGKHSKNQTYDMILNSRAGKTLENDYQHLAPCGRMVMVGASSAVGVGTKHWFKLIPAIFASIKSLFRFPFWRLMNDNKGLMGLNVLRYLEQKESAFELFQDFDFSKIDPPKVDSIFHAKKVGDAHTHIEKKRARGKVVISWQKVIE